jgi:HEAT repeat protein
MVMACSKVHPKAAVQPSPQDHQLSSAEIAQLIAQLDSPRREVRLTAMRRLDVSESKLPQTVIPPLVRVLKDPNLAMRESALSVLGNMGADAKVAVPAIIPLLKHEDYMGRSAAETLQKIGEPAKAAIPHIIPLLKHKDVGTRGAAVSAIGRLGKSTPATVMRHIVPLLKDREPYIQAAVIDALPDTGEPAKASMPLIIPLLKHKDYRVKSSALGALAVIGKSHANANVLVPHIVTVLNDREPYVRDGAIDALGKIGKSSPDLVMPHLLKLLKSPDSRDRGHTMMALANMRSAAKAAVPELLKMRSNDDVDSKDAVDWTLERIGREPLPE